MSAEEPGRKPEKYLLYYSDHELAAQYATHPPLPATQGRHAQAERYAELKDDGHRLACTIKALCPDSPEREIALQRVREAIMWASNSIAVNEKGPGWSNVPGPS